MATIHLELERADSRPESIVRMPTALSLFSGAGGLDIGLEQAGWNVLAQVEMDLASVATLRARSSDSERPAEVFQSRVEDLDIRGLREAHGLAPGDLDLLAGGPPCQPFTTHGRRRGLSDRRAESALPTYLDYVREFQPRALLMENVDGLLSAALRHRPLSQRGQGNPPLAVDEMKGSFLRWLVGELVGLGYATTWGLVEAADYGVPQLRQRAILIGVRGHQPCYLPPATHGVAAAPPYRAVRDVIADITWLGPVQPLSARKAAVYAQIPSGGNWRDLPVEVQRATMGNAFSATGGKSGWWRRLSWDAPAPTILGMPDHSSTALIHPDETRCLSVAECAALQTFPARTLFGGSPRSQYQQIGNAVPPQLGHALGRHLARFLNGAREGTPPRPDWRKTSANRRIGTHGWARPGSRGPRFHLHAQVRPDHVWAATSDVELTGADGTERRAIGATLG